MREQNAAVFVFRILVQILILSCEKICQCKTEEGDRARLQIFLSWIDDDGFTSRKRLNVLDEEIETEKQCASCWFIEEIAIETGESPDGSRLPDLVIIIGSLSIG